MDPSVWQRPRHPLHSLGDEPLRRTLVPSQRKQQQPGGRNNCPAPTCILQLELLFCLNRNLPGVMPNKTPAHRPSPRLEIFKNTRLARLYCPAYFLFSSCGPQYIDFSTLILRYPKHPPARPPISSPFDSAQERPPPGGRTCPAGRSSRRGSPGRAPAPPPPPGYPPPRAARAVPCGGVFVRARV